ncbi:histidine kinase [Actinomadura sp. ATCC 31491]|uniref:histidine kinase n=1 Tax=Actinomadura luzonensis TaxID=2805427 RepID=A0ABT0G7Z5_9ACTN|nr:sensor histidine kinase [Actinomadura luzonensis]MCK2220702.1 histidine kinase [Actinomadura luzonensis]
MKDARGRDTLTPEYRWALPAVLLGDGGGSRPVRRSTRDWLVDIAVFLLACGVTLVTLDELRGVPAPLLLAEQVLGALACASVWLRRRWPVGLALVLTALSTFLELVGGASLVALFTVAVHRPFKVSGPIALLNVLTIPPYLLIRPQQELPPLEWGIVLGALLLTVYAWGIVVRARRQLIWSLRQRADAAAEQARQAERERIAREMHDVLAHRVSMLSLHAGALEFRPDAPAADIARAAGAIRANAHLALQDLRQVIGVLRHPGAGGDDPVPERPQPTLADLPSLVEECRQAGMDVRLEQRAAGAPDGLGRNVYRIVQEALTNARKHAEGEPVTVTVTGAPGEGLAAEVRNPLGDPLAHRHAPRLPGAGAGLIGLAERAELAGGRLEHGPTPEGQFVVRARLPWPRGTTGENT